MSLMSANKPCLHSLPGLGVENEFDYGDGKKTLWRSSGSSYKRRKLWQGMWLWELGVLVMVQETSKDMCAAGVIKPDMHRSHIFLREILFLFSNAAFSERCFGICPIAETFILLTKEYPVWGKCRRFYSCNTFLVEFLWW